MSFEGPVQTLIEELGRLPGIGPKSAQRLAFHLLAAERADVERLATAILAAKDRMRTCARCCNVAEQDECRICRDPRRDVAQLCVVEEPRDVQAIERTGEWRGRYHVLGGALDPLAGVGPDQLTVKHLESRIPAEGVQELVLALSPNVHGDATASYLVNRLSGVAVRISRIASGLPVGGDLEYADEVTLGRAFAARRQVS